MSGMKALIKMESNREKEPSIMIKKLLTVARCTRDCLMGRAGFRQKTILRTIWSLIEGSAVFWKEKTELSTNNLLLALFFNSNRL